MRAYSGQRKIADMEMNQEEIDDGIIKVTLNGSLDIAGAGVVDMPFNILSGKHDKVIVDFTDVDFLASIGIRVLVKTAKSITVRGGRLAIYNASDAAKKVLSATGADTIVFVVDDAAAAIATVQ